MSDRAIPPAESRIEIVCRDGVWIVALHGEHDLATHSALRAELARVAAAGGRIVVDLSPASFLDSSVVRALVSPAAGDESHPQVADVVAPEGTFAGRLAALVGLDAVVRVHGSVEEALGGGPRR